MARRKKKKQPRSRTQKAATLLLALLAGMGAWNFKRNVEAEKAEPRPFQNYSDADLEQLIGAYEKELDQYLGVYEQVSGEKIDIRDVGLLGERVAQFERVQGASQRTRDLAAKVAKLQVALDRLLWEKSQRDAGPVGVFLQRLLTF